jgi:outer membrane protein
MSEPGFSKIDGRLRGAASILIALALGGCAASSLSLAPEGPDIPFKPDVPVNSGAAAAPLPKITASGARDFSLPPIATRPFVDATTPVDSTHFYSLVELIDLAQTNNPDTRIAWQQARQAALAIGITEALYLPVLSATAVGGFQHTSGSSDISLSSVGSLPANNSSSELKGAVSSVALQWLVLDFGQRDALTQVAKELSLARNISFNATHQKIIYNVSRAFYDYTSARQKVTITEQTKKETARLLDAANEKSAHGVGTSVEVAEAAQLLAQANFALVQAQGLERDAYHTLLSNVGLPPMTSIRVIDVSQRLLPEAATAPVVSLITGALGQRLDIQAGYATARAAKAGIAAAEADFLPKVFLSGSATFINGSLDITSLPSISSLTPNGASPGAASTTTDRNNQTILGGVFVPIYDGGVRQARLLEAQSRVDAAEATIDRLQQDAATEIVAADDALRSSIAANHAASALVQASAVSLDAAFSAYKSGAGTLTAAIEAEKALLSARLAQAQAHGTALIAAATLTFTVGRLASSDALNSRAVSLPAGPLH